jgi:hypothetical protein
MADFNFLVAGVIAGAYIAAVLLLMSATAILSRKGKSIDINSSSGTKKFSNKKYF